MTYQSLNPFNGELVESFDPLGDAPLETKIATAQACFETWRHTSYAERARIIAKAGEILHARADEFASAGITLTKGDLSAIVRARRLARATMGNIRQNLFFSFLFNGIGVPIAAGILYPVAGILLSPMIAGAAMALSSFTVVLNALRLSEKAL
jgi:Cu+-exporting ATPase